MTTTRRPAIESVGQRFGRLVVTTIYKRGDGQACATAVCDCGKQWDGRLLNLRSGSVRSCGCLNRDSLIKRNTKHGLSHLPEYHVWREMKARCTNPNNAFFNRYGGRGIRVSPEWVDDFDAFYNHVGPRPSDRYSIERKDNDMDYEPGNCIWATMVEQANNRVSNRCIEYKGETRTLTGWCRFLNKSLQAITQRIDVCGWSIEKAFTVPCSQFKERKHAKSSALSTTQNCAGPEV